jgi:hypothetical protein
MIDVKQAIKTARDYVADLYLPEGAVDLMLEEVRLGDDNDWRITIGFTIAESKVGRENVFAAMEMRTRNVVRKYKEVRIDPNTGQVKAMLVRDPLATAS